MGRTVEKIWWSPATEGTPALVVAAAFYAFGGIIGCFMALRTADSGAAAMASYLDRFWDLALAGELNGPDLLSSLWCSIRWPLAVFLLGPSQLGLLAIPVLASLRGFFLSFSVSSFARAYGYRGLAMASLLLGIPAMLAIPAFLLLAAQCLATAFEQVRNPQGIRKQLFNPTYLTRCCLCGGMTLVSVLLECYLIPVLTAEVGTLLR